MVRGLGDRIVFDPRSVATHEFAWVGSIRLSASASSSCGVGLARLRARTVVTISGCIAYIN